MFLTMVYVSIAEEENGGVRIQPVPGILAAALICALVPGCPGFTLHFAQSKADAQTLPAPEARIDVNTTLEQLAKVPGMTRTWAARIIRYRPYRSKNDLVDRGCGHKPRI